MSVSIFAYRDLAIRVECAAAPLQWLTEFLAPAFTVRDDGAADCTVALEVDDRAYRAVLARGPRNDGEQAGCFALDGGMIRLPWWTSTDDERVIFDEPAQVFYGVRCDGARARVLSGQQLPSRRVGLLRVVRELAISQAWSATSAVLHAAALAIGDAGIVVAGPKSAGKTTLLLQLLLCGRGAAFVSNDRVVIDAAGGHLRLCGMPTIVKVLRPPADRLPELHRRLAPVRGDYRLTISELTAKPATADNPGRGADGRTADDPLHCTPAQLCALLGTRMQGHARPAVLLFPRVSASRVGMHLEALSPAAAAARLRTLFLGGPSPAVSEVFTLTSKPGRIDPVGLDGLSRTLADGMRSFDCLLGPDSDRPEASHHVLERILADDAARTPPRAVQQ